MWSPPVWSVSTATSPSQGAVTLATRYSSPTAWEPPPLGCTPFPGTVGVQDLGRPPLSCSCQCTHFSHLLTIYYVLRVNIMSRHRCDPALGRLPLGTGGGEKMNQGFRNRFPTQTPRSPTSGARSPTQQVNGSLAHSVSVYCMPTVCLPEPPQRRRKGPEQTRTISESQSILLGGGVQEGQEQGEVRGSPRCLGKAVQRS